MNTETSQSDQFVGRIAIFAGEAGCWMTGSRKNQWLHSGDIVLILRHENLRCLKVLTGRARTFDIATSYFNNGKIPMRSWFVVI